MVEETHKDVFPRKSTNEPNRSSPFAIFVPKGRVSGFDSRDDKKNDSDEDSSSDSSDSSVELRRKKKVSVKLHRALEKLLEIV